MGHKDTPLFTNEESLRTHAALLTAADPVVTLVAQLDRARTTAAHEHSDMIKCTSCGNEQHWMGSDIWCEFCGVELP